MSGRLWVTAAATLASALDQDASLAVGVLNGSFRQNLPFAKRVTSGSNAPYGGRSTADCACPLADVAPELNAAS